MLEYWSCALISIALCLLTGCGVTMPLRHSRTKLDRIAVGQTKAEVLNRLGEPDGEFQPSDVKPDAVIEIFHFYGKSAPIYNAVLCPFTFTLSCWFPIMTATSTYWFEYADGKLVHWKRVPDDSRRSLIFPRYPVP